MAQRILPRLTPESFHLNTSLTQYQRTGEIARVSSQSDNIRFAVRSSGRVEHWATGCQCSIPDRQSQSDQAHVPLALKLRGACKTVPQKWAKYTVPSGRVPSDGPYGLTVGCQACGDSTRVAPATPGADASVLDGFSQLCRNKFENDIAARRSRHFNRNYGLLQSARAGDRSVSQSATQSELLRRLARDGIPSKRDMGEIVPAGGQRHGIAPFKAEKTLARSFLSFPTIHPDSCCPLLRQLGLPKQGF